MARIGGSGGGDLFIGRTVSVEDWATRTLRRLWPRGARRFWPRGPGGPGFVGLGGSGFVRLGGSGIARTGQARRGLDRLAVAWRPALPGCRITKNDWLAA